MKPLNCGFKRITKECIIIREHIYVENSVMFNHLKESKDFQKKSVEKEDNCIKSLLTI